MGRGRAEGGTIASPDGYYIRGTRLSPNPADSEVGVFLVRTDGGGTFRCTPYIRTGLRIGEYDELITLG